MSPTPDWLFPLRKADGRPPAARLLVFPYAAAGATSLRPLVSRLPPSVEVLGVALPGRERRFSDPPTSDHTEVVGAVAAALTDRPPLPTYLLGHSMGAGLALAVALAAPASCAGLVLSGRKPHGVALGSVRGLADDEVLSFLGSVGNTNPQLLTDDFWRGHLLALFRSDTELDTRASRAIDAARLSLPVLALGGADDPYVDADDLYSWAARTSAECRVEIFPGNHFFLLDPANRDAVAHSLTAFTQLPDRCLEFASAQSPESLHPEHRR